MGRVEREGSDSLGGRCTPSQWRWASMPLASNVFGILERPKNQMKAPRERARACQAQQEKQ